MRSGSNVGKRMYGEVGMHGKEGVKVRKVARREWNEGVRERVRIRGVKSED